ncbi:MAG TPA: EAL domain-containing protein [Chromatiales bacterium]|nr:EAL domain-containing protein [Chromatiales bacterium]
MGRGRRPVWGSVGLLGVASAALILNLAFLLFQIHYAEGELQAAAGRQLRQEAQKRSEALGQFFQERRMDLLDLRQARAIRAYFENKALGMTERYGLRASVVQIRMLFEDVLQRRRARRGALYEALALVLPDGVVLAAAPGDWKPPRGWLPPAIDVDGPVIRPGPGRTLWVLTDYRFKGRLAGHLLAKLSPGAIRAYLHDGRRGVGTDLLVDEKGRPLVAPVHAALTRPLLQRLRALPAGEVATLAVEGEGRLVAVRLPLGVAGLQVVATAPYDAVYAQRPLRYGFWVSLGLSLVLGLSWLAILRYWRANQLLNVRVARAERQKGRLRGENAALAREVERRQQAERRLQEALREAHMLAHYDCLTGLPNRRLFRSSLEQAMARCGEGPGQVALLVLDLDRFNRVNDTLGHSVGDALLEWVAHILQECLRGTDTVGRVAAASDVARQAGDEFMILVQGIRRPEDALHVARRILHALQRPVRLGDIELTPSASIGIAVYPEHGTDVETLMKNADAAVHAAKAKGGGRIELYEPNLNASGVEVLSLEADLRHALEREEFEVHYQPKLNLRTGQPGGVEALLRWRHPRRGMVSPMAFIPIAEETGLITELSDWLLRQVLHDSRWWHERTGMALRFAANISCREFCEGDVAARIERLLRETGTERPLLDVELTESVLLHNTELTRAELVRLRELGLRMHLDDFGTGYSALSYLKRFPIDVLKIDRSFVNGLPADESDAEIVRAVVALGTSLGMTLVAEGVETVEQLYYLRRLGCHEGQGYLFGRPVPLPQLLEWFRAWMSQGRRQLFMGAADWPQSRRTVA